LRLSVLSSGSSGNATYIEGTSGGVLVDAGLQAKRLSRLLANIGRSLHDVGAVFVTHDHSDHTCGLRSLLREVPVPVYGAPGVGERLGSPGATVVEAGEPLHLRDLRVTFFPVPHDAPTYGVELVEEDRSVVVATDLGEVDEGALGIMRGAEALVLEANHELEWLRRGPYPADLKRRVASGRGHLSNEQAAEAAIRLAPHGLRELVLAHLSKTNNSPARATNSVSRALREAGWEAVRVRAALANHPTPWIEVGEPAEPKSYVYRYDTPQNLFGME
jgi:phosphoribosyl 1,2-cyclic phosphodiesterase